jgi:transcriptional regulator with XRE-family HTH domain
MAQHWHFCGHKLRELRVFKGLRQSDLAKILSALLGEKIHPNNIGLWEREVFQPSPCRIKALSVLLGVSMDAFFAERRACPMSSFMRRKRNVTT